MPSYDWYREVCEVIIVVIYKPRISIATFCWHPSHHKFIF